MTDGKVGHDAFAVIRETIREMNKVAIGRVVLTNREHIIALEPMDKGLMGTLLRYPYEVRSADEKSTISRMSKSPRTCSISPGTSSIRRRATRAGQVRRPVRNRPHRSHQPEARRQTHHRESATAWRERRRFDGRSAQEHRRRRGRQRTPSRQRSHARSPAVEKEMLLPIAGKKPAKEAAAKKPAAKSQRKSA